MSKISHKYDRSYYRTALRSLFVSLFWVIITSRKKRQGGFTFQALAKAIGSTKHEVSRWFNGDPNWTLNTIASLAHALDVELIIHARERSTGIIYTPAGIQVSANTASNIDTRNTISTSAGGVIASTVHRMPVPRVGDWGARSRVAPSPDTSASFESARAA